MKNLIAATKYIVKREFIDYDKIIHPIGETWVFVNISYVAYHDGVCLHVLFNESPTKYRFMDIPEEQKAIIDNFLDYVDVDK